jgi:hypothetical protein
MPAAAVRLAGMGDVAVERNQPAPEAGPEAAVARTPAAVQGGLSPARLLALQSTAGNRAVVRMIARTISDDVFNITQEVGKKKPPDKTTIDSAIKVAKQAYAEVQRLQAAKSGDDKIAEAYKDVYRVVSALVSAGAENDAIDFAKTCDSTVQTGALNALRSYSGGGVEGQQKFAATAGRLVGVTVAAPTAGQTSAGWLEAQTEKIGETYKKLEAAGLKGLDNDPNSSLSLTFVSEMLKKYFTLSDTDVKPDPLGKVGKLKVGADKQLEVDCDVYATYATRLLRAAGWTTVGYMAIVPGEDTGRDAHAVALAKRAASGGKTDYVAVSDFMLKEFQAADDDAARDPLLKHGLDIYSGRGEPGSWKAYYSPAGAGGAYDMKLLDPVKNGLTAYKSK